MENTFIPRNLAATLKKAAQEFPAVILIGARQSGKTTLINHLFAKTHNIISLEPPDVRLAAQTDPRGFLRTYAPPLVFDEIQYTPDLLPYIKELIDARRSLCGQFILTGSHNFLMMSQATESLAGRAAVLHLMPLTFGEVARLENRSFPWEGPLRAERIFSTVDQFWEQVLRGFYPELNAQTHRDVRLWQASYVQTYLERDVRNLRNLGNLTQFNVFLRALAARAAQLLNLSELARDIGVAVNTIKDWLSILEASFQVFILHPYYENVGKRLVKSPKVYFTDSGLLCYLVGLYDKEHAAAGPMGGALVENVVIADIYKTFLHRGETPPLYFWRTAAGEEVDLVIETSSGLIPIEIKKTETPLPEMARGIRLFRNLYQNKVLEGYVIHLGNHILPLGEGVMALPLGLL